MLKALVAGCFSFENGHATAGDVLASEVVCTWLEQAGIPYDVAMTSGIGPGVDWAAADPGAYSHLLYVCGPFERGELETGLLLKFAGCRLIGIDLTMLTPLDAWNPFDLLLERDSSRAAHPDITFASQRQHVPLVGVCLVEDYPGAAVPAANAAIERLMASSTVARIDIDTRLDTNATGLRTPAEIESVLARMDAVVTTRLHGMVLSLKNGVPVLAIDPETGGAKVMRQAECIGWPVALPVDASGEAALQEALSFCLSDAARAQARECRERATRLVEEIRRRFASEVMEGKGLGLAQDRRAERTVSVIIHCHDRSVFLEQAIASVRAQTHCATEIIVVDTTADGAPPADSDVCRLHEPGARSAAACSAGLAAAHGEYLVFMDADDRLLPHSLQTGLNCFHLYPESAFVSGRSRYVAAEETANDGCAVARRAKHDAPSPPPNGYCAPATAMYRREVVQAAGGFSAARQGCEEYALQLRIAHARPSRRHGVLVAERLLHDRSSVLDAGFILRELLATLVAERPSISDDPRKLREWRANLRFARKSSLAPLLHRLRSQAAGSLNRQALELIFGLARYLPLWTACRWRELRASLGPSP